MSDKEIPRHRHKFARGGVECGDGLLGGCAFIVSGLKKEYFLAIDGESSRKWPSSSTRSNYDVIVVFELRNIGRTFLVDTNTLEL
jgi:hypothetical protein